VGQQSTAARFPRVSVSTATLQLDADATCTPQFRLTSRQV